MYKYPTSYIANLKRDRKKGMSISVLMEKYHMPKTSVWHHVKDIKLSPITYASIRSRQGGSRARKERQIARAADEAKEIFGTNDDRFVALVALSSLYWAEGSKGSFVFTNTDGRMIAVFLSILRRYLGVQNEELDILIRITRKMDKGRCRSYWSQVTKVSLNNIMINVNDRQNNGKSKYGICRITLKKGGYRLKLMNSLAEQITYRLT